MREPGRWVKDLLWVLVFLGLVAMGMRLWFGLGATTQLSDTAPWGLWKILNMVAGVALSTSGFTVGFLVYVLKLERFRPFLKPAILVAFLGYGSSVFALVLDIGLPWRIWHPILMWNVHSFLFEVAWCVMLYFTVTILELSPTVLERFRLTRPAALLHRASPAIVIVGITLSSLHHTSLGSLFLVTPQRLHPLWYTPRIPFLFILSAMGAGLMTVVLARILYARWYEPDSLRERSAGAAGTPLVQRLASLATIAAGVLGVYLVFKIADLVATGALPALLAGTWESWLYLAELLLSAAIPVAIVLAPRLRRSAGALTAAALVAVAGLALNRLDVGIFGYFRDAGSAYLPSLTEWALSLGTIAAAVLVLLFAAENLPIFGDRPARELRREAAPPHDRSLLGQPWRAPLVTGLRRVSLIGLLVLPFAWMLMYPPFHAPRGGQDRPVRAPIAADAERSVLRLDGNRAGLRVDFPHQDHERRLGGKDSCRQCHHLSLPRDHSTPCSRCHGDMEKPTGLFDHTAHQVQVASRDRLAGPLPANRSCAACHPAKLPRGSESVKPCMECHREDMSPVREPEEPLGLGSASGYRVALHDTCITCHREEEERGTRPGLGECGWCHPSIRGGSEQVIVWEKAPQSRLLEGRESAEDSLPPVRSLLLDCDTAIDRSVLRETRSLTLPMCISSETLFPVDPITMSDASSCWAILSISSAAGP